MPNTIKKRTRHHNAAIYSIVSSQQQRNNKRSQSHTKVFAQWRSSVNDLTSASVFICFVLAQELLGSRDDAI